VFHGCFRPASPAIPVEQTHTETRTATLVAPGHPLQMSLRARATTASCKSCQSTVEPTGIHLAPRAITLRLKGTSAWSAIPHAYHLKKSNCIKYQCILTAAQQHTHVNVAHARQRTTHACPPGYLHLCTTPGQTSMYRSSYRHTGCCCACLSPTSLHWESGINSNKAREGISAAGSRGYNQGLNIRCRQCPAKAIHKLRMQIVRPATVAPCKHPSTSCQFLNAVHISRV